MTLDKFRYRLDGLMSRGTPALLVGLLLGTIVIITLVSAILLIFDLSPHDDTTPGEIVWTTFMHTYDPSQIAYDEGGWIYKCVVFIACLGGLFVLSALIGVLTTGFDNKIQELRKGKSPVVESGHTLILGWSKQIFHVINELVAANANQHRACIVVLADHDKVEMEDELRLRVAGTGATRIVCRTGSPLDLADLDIASPNSARAIVVLPPDNDLRPDICTVKTILALVNNPRRKQGRYTIVASLSDTANIEVAELIARDEAHILHSDEIISKIITQTCRQPGLSRVYMELLDFDGDELYIQKEPLLTGSTFGEALFRYEDSALIGLQHSDGSVLINPPSSTLIAHDDAIIAIARDDDTVVVSSRTHSIREELIVTGDLPSRQPERTLICGWNERVPIILRELDDYVAPGSEAVVIADRQGIDQRLAEFQFQKLRVRFLAGDTSSRKALVEAECMSYDNIIVMSYEDTDIQEADAITLMTLVQLRDIAEKSGAKPSVVSEMMDDRNRELASITSANDFIVSNKINALLLAQLSENPALKEVFIHLLSAEGSELYIRPAREYIQLHTSVDFYTVLESARRKGELAIGYRSMGTAGDTIRVNPAKSEKRTYGDNDMIIVLAEE